MGTNRELMQQTEILTAAAERHELNEFHLSMENRELRDRIEILESVIATSNIQAQDLDAIDWRSITAPLTEAIKKNNTLETLFEPKLRLVVTRAESLIDKMHAANKVRNNDTW